VQLETARLLLRPPRLADAAALLRFLGDTETMQYTAPRTSLRDCRRYLAAHERQRRRVGCAPWVIIERGDDGIIGFGGLYQDPFAAGWGIEVGYFFARQAWGRGFATELTQHCIEMARVQPDWPSLHAFAHPDNVASRRVLAKTGFKQQRYVPEMERLLYRRDLT
jgi:[ribosomal protein S5]-alanine N-acetyltransferase